MKRVIKRGFDIVCSALAVVVLSPILLLSAICIRCSSPGPVFYRAQRVGKNGKRFAMLKFRSMHVADGARENSFIADEERIFPWGAFMRKSKIDELPQLISILKGDMSIVGPRPFSAESADKLLTGEYQEIVSMRPGLTSYASLFDYKHGELFVSDNQQYRREILPVKLELELYYVHNWTVWKDFKLILSTVICILQVVFGKIVFTFTPVEEYAMASAKSKNAVGSGE